MAAFLRLARVTTMCCGCSLLLGEVELAAQGDRAAAALKTEHFDREPGWEAFDNRVAPPAIPLVQQDFGYGASHHAGASAGEVGGRVHRANRPAYYAASIPPKTLRDRFSASGTFALTASEPGGGAFFGWFNAEQPGGSGRPIQSLGLDFGSERSGGRLAVRLINRENRSTGFSVTTREPKLKPTSIRNDGTRYRWSLDYDPDAHAGRGRFTFTIASDARTPAAFERKMFTADLPAGFKEAGATFDRFGLMNALKGGGGLEIYFDDLEIDGRAENFSADPRWIGLGNRDRYRDRERPGAHDFGYSATTRFAGGEAAGEVGGDFWRTGKGWGYYADRIGPFSLEQRLGARGKVQFAVGGPDSAMCLGFFNSERKAGGPPDHTGDFVGVRIGGPTRIGHYFAPLCVTAKGSPTKSDTAPIIVPGRLYDWSLLYDPAANDGGGALEVRLGDETKTLPLKRGRKAEGARLDRFGLFSTHPGGQMVRIFVDDVTYTATAPPR